MFMDVRNPPTHAYRLEDIEERRLLCVGCSLAFEISVCGNDKFMQLIFLAILLNYRKIGLQYI